MIKKYSQLGTTLPNLGVCGGLALVSIFMIPIPTLGFELPKLFITAVFASAASLSAVIAHQRSIDLLMRSGAGKALLFFTVVVFSSLLWSVAPVLSIMGAAPRFQGIVAHGAYITIAIFAAFLVRTDRGLHTAYKGILLSNLLVVCYGALQMLHADPLSILWQGDAFLGRVFSTIGHPNALGQFVLLTCPFVIARWMTSKNLLWGVLCILNGVVLLGTVSRAALLGAVLLFLVALPSMRRWKIGSSQKVCASVLVVLTLCIGAIFFAQRFAGEVEQGRSTAARQVIWTGIVQMIAERPIGYGLESLAIQTPRFIGKQLYAYESLTTVVDRAHSTPLQLLVTLGPLGFLSYYLLVGALLLAAWKERTGQRRLIVLTAGSALFGYTIATLFGFPSVASAVLFWFVCGMLIGLLTPEGSPRFSAVASMILNVSLLALSLFLFLVTAQWTHARILHESARLAGSLPLHQQGILAFENDRQSLMETIEHHLHAIEKEEDPAYRDDLVKSAKSLIVQLHRVTNNEDGMAHLLDAWFSALRGETEKMEEHFALAKAKLPQSIAYHRTAAHVHTYRGDFSEVDAHHEGIRSLLPSDVWDETSELRRILLKQHPWLEELL